MEYLKILSLKHSIAVITSIHQPNTDILLMFNKLYVLAKGGICLYSGPPQDLNHHLNECQIICSEYQIPIEVLIKYAIKGISDENVLRLSENTSKDNQSLLEKCENEAKLFPNGIPFKSKSFKLIDMWYLLLRSMTKSYISEWKSILIQLLLYIMFPLITTGVYNSQIGEPDGCISLSFNSTTSCEQQLYDDSLLDENTKFIYFSSTFIQISITTLIFPHEVKLFLNEHRNGDYII